MGQQVARLQVLLVKVSFCQAQVERVIMVSIVKIPLAIIGVQVGGMD